MSKTVAIDYQGVRDNILNADFTIAMLKEQVDAKAREVYGSDFHSIAFKGNQRGHAIAFPNTEGHPT